MRSDEKRWKGGVEAEGPSDKPCLVVRFFKLVPSRSTSTSFLPVKLGRGRHLIPLDCVCKRRLRRMLIPEYTRLVVHHTLHTHSRHTRAPQNGSRSKTCAKTRTIAGSQTVPQKAVNFQSLDKPNDLMCEEHGNRQVGMHRRKAECRTRAVGTVSPPKESGGSVLPEHGKVATQHAAMATTSRSDSRGKHAQRTVAEPATIGDRNLLLSAIFHGGVEDTFQGKAKARSSSRFSRRFKNRREKRKILRPSLAYKRKKM